VLPLFGQGKGAGRLGPRRHFAETIPILRPPGHVYAYMVHRCKHGANPHASHVYCSTARASGALYSLLYYTGSPTLYSCYNCGRHFRFHFKGFLDGFTAQEKKNYPTSSSFCHFLSRLTKQLHTTIPQFAQNR